MNDSIQSKVRQEIKDMLVRSEGKIDYNSLMSATEMPYLHQVILETLRLHPILPILERECTEPEGFSLEPFTDFTIPQGMPVYIPIYAMQRDEKYFPNPLLFDPDRFSPENINQIQPFTFLPFGIGNRNCIGERFGLMQVKMGLVRILKDFRLEKTAQTPETIVLDKKAMLVKADKGLFLNLVKDSLI